MLPITPPWIRLAQLLMPMCAIIALTGAEIDTRFGRQGTVLIRPEPEIEYHPSFDSAGNSIFANTSDGGLLVRCRHFTPSGVKYVVAKVDHYGVTDRRYAHAGVHPIQLPFPPETQAMASDNHGGLVLVHTSVNVPEPLVIIDRLDHFGFPLEAFANNGRLFLPITMFVRAVRTFPDGSLLMWGRGRTGPFDDWQTILVRITATGEVNAGYGTQGIAWINEYSAIQVSMQDDGSALLLSGEGIMKRVMPSGQIDEGFGTSGAIDLSPTLPITSAWPRPNGGMIVVQRAPAYPATPWITLTRYTPFGLVDSTVATISISDHHVIGSLVLELPDRRLLVNRSYNSPSYPTLLAYLPNGVRDMEFWGKVTSNTEQVWFDPHNARLITVDSGSISGWRASTGLPDPTFAQGSWLVPRAAGGFSRIDDSTSSSRLIVAGTAGDTPLFTEITSAGTVSRITIAEEEAHHRFIEGKVHITSNGVESWASFTTRNYGSGSHLLVRRWSDWFSAFSNELDLAETPSYSASDLAWDGLGHWTLRWQRGTTHRALRFTADGVRDLAWGDGGMVNLDGLAGRWHGHDHNGRMLLVSPASSLVIRRFNQDGSPDGTYGTDGVAVVESLGLTDFTQRAAWTVDADNGVWIASTPGTPPSLRVDRVNSAGQPATPRSQSGYAIPYTKITKVIPADHGAHWVVGTYQSSPKDSDIAISKIAADGEMVSSFGNSGTLVVRRPYPQQAFAGHQLAQCPDVLWLIADDHGTLAITKVLLDPMRDRSAFPVVVQASVRDNQVSTMSVTIQVISPIDLDPETIAIGNLVLTCSDPQVQVIAAEIDANDPSIAHYTVSGFTTSSGTLTVGLPAQNMWSADQYRTNAASALAEPIAWEFPAETGPGSSPSPPAGGLEGDAGSGCGSGSGTVALGWLVALVFSLLSVTQRSPRPPTLK